MVGGEGGEGGGGVGVSVGVRGRGGVRGGGGVRGRGGVRVRGGFGVCGGGDGVGGEGWGWSEGTGGVGVRVGVGWGEGWGWGVRVREWYTKGSKLFPLAAFALCPVLVVSLTRRTSPSSRCGTAARLSAVAPPTSSGPSSRSFLRRIHHRSGSGAVAGEGGAVTNVIVGCVGLLTVDNTQ